MVRCVVWCNGFIVFYDGDIVLNILNNYVLVFVRLLVSLRCKEVMVLFVWFIFKNKGLCMYIVCEF